MPEFAAPFVGGHFGVFEFLIVFALASFALWIGEKLGLPFDMTFIGGRDDAT